MKHLLVLVGHVCSINPKTANKALVYGESFNCCSLPTASTHTQFLFSGLEESLTGKMIDTYRSYHVHSKLGNCSQGVFQAKYIKGDVDMVKVQNNDKNDL